MERCRQEIAAIEAELLAGNPDVAGLCLALADWSAELRILESIYAEPQDAESLPTDREIGAPIGRE
jgi:hypothetical protein